ncbi:serine/arginine repetitive matrix protein 1-like [Salvia splendens]|uniref:serine/arginine repetitive matrix protein 1-like n=1 Tax=Salvia splendens TaxID=180675 RepID=UPI001C2559D7|nr:serine/arginine repetitive matrix protein 1-like [Salvia splendens]
MSLSCLHHHSSLLSSSFSSHPPPPPPTPSTPILAPTAQNARISYSSNMHTSQDRRSWRELSATPTGTARARQLRPETLELLLRGHEDPEFLHRHSVAESPQFHQQTLGIVDLRAVARERDRQHARPPQIIAIARAARHREYLKGRLQHDSQDPSSRRGISATPTGIARAPSSARSSRSRIPSSPFCGRIPSISSPNPLNSQPPPPPHRRPPPPPPPLCRRRRRSFQQRVQLVIRDVYGYFLKQRRSPRHFKLATYSRFQPENYKVGSKGKY